jgi:protocatechuate 3,4-dioxygenase beta subunit
MFGLKLDRLFGSSLSHKQTQRRRVKNRYTRSLQFDRLEDRRMLSVNLGTAGNFAVLSGQTITNTDPSVISGNVGLSPGTAVTGFPPGTVNNGTIHTADAVASQAQIDLTTAYNAVAGEAVTSDLTGQNLGGLTLTPGVYHFSSSAQLTGVLTLNAEGNPDAEFDFQIGSTLTTASNSSVVMINGGIPCDVVWQVGSSATLGTTTAFEGHILALTSITVQTGASVQGSVLARNGSVTLDDNVINNLNCTNGSISGTVFNDATGGGVQQSGAVGLAGVTVFLDANNTGVFAAGDTTATTDANGNYSFTNLGPGTYHVLEVPQSGVQQTTTNPVAITLGMGTAISGVNFGDFNTVSISGSVFQDTNDNGVRDTGEAGLAGVTVFLDTNNTGVFAVGDTTATTDANGNYSFANLGPGTYHVAEVLPTGFTQTTTSPSAIVTSSGANVSGVNFGDFQAVSTSTSISGTVFNDVTGGGVQQSGAVGLAGVTVFLDANNTGVFAAGDTTATTDANGNYSFTNLAAGTYHVVEVLPTGFLQTTSSSTAITLIAGQIVSAVNFGDFKMVSISGSVLQDTTSNGICHKYEAGLAGVTVFLDTNNTGVFAVGDTTATTDANGNYSFANLGPGTYHVAEVLPTGFTQTTTSPAAIVTSSGTNVSGVNFGDSQAVSTSASASISGTVFKDTSGSGVLTSCEAGLAGATVFLDANNNGVFAAGDKTATTDANGNYSFTNLAAGTYHVVEVLPTGFLQTTSSSTAITLTAGQIVSAVNFGDFKMVSISGSVLQDTNSNGVCHKYEAGLAGATVFLDTNNNGVLDSGETSTTTNASGNYTFSNLGPGTYHVAEVLPTGFRQVTTSPAAIVTSSGNNVRDVIFGNLEAVSTSIGGRTNWNGNGGRNTCAAALPDAAAYNCVPDTADESTSRYTNRDYAFANRDYAFANRDYAFANRD